MAASLLIGPKDRLPHVAHGEYQYASIKEAQTAVLVAAGSGVVHSVTIGVVGAGTLILYDLAAGVTPSASTNEIATLSVAALTSGPFILDVAFSKGLTAVLDVAAHVTVYFWGAPVQSSRTFGI
jgi:hypothetical protein